MIIIFDRKFEYHTLLEFPGFIYLLLADYATNWLQPPPGVAFVNWIGVLGEVLGNYLDIRVASRGLFLSVATALYDEWLSGARALFPTFHDINDYLGNKRYPLLTHHARHKETLENRNQQLLTSYGDSICSRRIIDWKQFTEGNWAVSLLGIPTDLQNLFISVTISQILMYRIANNLRNPQLEVLFVLDEAGPLFKRWYETQEGTYWLSQCLAMSREYGVGFLISNQGLSDLSHSVMANTATKFLVGGAGLGSDWDVFASATSIDQESKRYLQQNLTPGFAAVKDPRYPHVFVIQTPRIS